MSNTNWKDIVELVGISAIVASLIFVGLQMKQSQEIALSQAFQLRSDTSIDVLLATTENPTYISGLRKGRAGEPLSEDEKGVMRQYVLVFLYMWENLHYQYVNGFIEKDRWLSGRELIRHLTTENNGLPIRATFEQSQSRFNTEFTQEIQELFAEIDEGK